MYAYIFDNSGFEIKTPGAFDFSQVKNELISQTPEEIVRRSTYPTGLVLEIHQSTKQTTIYSNRPLTKNSDGSYTAPEA